MLLAREHALPLVFSKVGRVFHGGALLALCTQSTTLQWQTAHLGAFLPNLLLVAAALGWVASWFAIEGWQLVVRQSPLRVLALSVALAALTVYPILSQSNSTWLCPWVAEGSARLLRLFHFSVAPRGNGLSYLSVYTPIAASCSGLHGMFLFTELFFLFVAMFAPRWSVRKFALFYFLGLLLIHALNVVRVSCLIAVLYWAVEKGRSWDMDATFHRLHLGLGWALYSTGILAYLAALRQWGVPTSDPQSHPRYSP